MVDFPELDTTVEKNHPASRVNHSHILVRRWAFAVNVSATDRSPHINGYSATTTLQM
jgi:hypothetical protein